MEKHETSDPDEHSPSPPEVRAAAASRSTWVSVAVNVASSSAQIVVGVLAKLQALIADGLHSLA
jgi:divalent metal cation (Fe/Co/Zn/Cd) transporter